MIKQEKLKKPLLLIFPFNVLAHYLRCLKLARYLNTHFEVRFLESDKYSSFIIAEGFSTFSCANLNEEKVLDCMSRFDFSWLNKNDLDPVYNSQVEAIRGLKPLAVLGDMSPTLKMAAEAAGVKYIALMNGYMSRYYALVHEMPHAHPLYKFMKHVPEALAEYFIQFGEQLALKEIHHEFKKLRKQYGLSKQDSYADEMEGDINLLCDLPALFPQKVFPSNYGFIPPLFYDKGNRLPGLNDIVDKNKKTIYVTMGSTGNWNNVAFLNDPFFSRYNIITAGDTNNVVNKEGVIKTGFVSMHDIFPYTDLVICHGGNGTMYQALHYGVPLLFKTAHLEQQRNVRGLEKLGVGKSLNNISNPEEYAHCVEQWSREKGSPHLLEVQKQVQDAERHIGNAVTAIVEGSFFPAMEKN